MVSVRRTGSHRTAELPQTAGMQTFEVNRQDLRDTRIVDADRVALEPGQIRLKLERFAFTTNNITYAVAGDMLDYWGFFPAEAPFGRVPAMGLATVAESAHPEISEGGRYFGFYPMADESVIAAEPRGDAFCDVGPHRANHAAVYTHFRNTATDPTFRENQVDEYLLLWGMFMTSFLVDDYIDDNNFNGASQTLVTSASSKTSISLASCLARREGHKAIGLTSERNRAFVEGLGMYDQVITYDEVDTLDASIPSGVVDMAGSATVRSSVHGHFTDNLMFSIAVGATHWEDQGGQADLPGPTPEFFFAPSQTAKRSKEWGAEVLANKIAEAFGALLDTTDHWLTVEHHDGPEGIESTYRSLLEGQADPATGYTCSMDG